ncbi:MFS general substrate transporter [Xylaria sp. CBS 124048]|nr:MFS general substrate transporter [Xylaria sp. CBS 124048]
MASGHFDPGAIPARTLSRGSRRESYINRSSRPTSQIYHRYSLPSVYSESNLELAPSPLVIGRGADFANIHLEAAQAIKEQPDSTSAGESGNLNTSRSQAITGGRWFLIVIAVLINTFVYAVDNTVVAVIQPAIVKQFDNLTDLPWVSTGFILAGTATALPLTGLYGALDAKWLYITFTVIFTAASALCGAAPTMPALIVGRVIAGIGGNGMYLGALTLISVFCEPSQTSLYIGFIGLSWGAGTVIGPLIGGALEGSAGWRWAFYINLIIGAVSIPILLILTPSYRPRPLDVSAIQALRNIDWVGSALSLPAFVFIITAISFGGTQFPWDGAFIVSFFWAAGVFFVGFWLQQLSAFKTTLSSRLFPIHFFARKDLLLMFIIQASAGGIVVVPLYLMALYYPFAKAGPRPKPQTLPKLTKFQDNTALEAGVKLLPMVTFLVAGIIVNGYAMGIWGYHQAWIVVGSILVLVSGVFFSRLTVATSDATIYGLQVVLGIGTGAFSQAGFAIAQAMVDPGEIQNAISFMLIAQLAGTSFGLSISGAIFQNLSVPRVAAALGPGFTSEQVIRIVSRIDESLIASLPPELYGRAQDIVVNAITNGLVLIYAGGALCLICGICLTPKPKLLGAQPDQSKPALPLDLNGFTPSQLSDAELRDQHFAPRREGYTQQGAWADR